MKGPQRPHKAMIYVHIYVEREIHISIFTNVYMYTYIYICIDTGIDLYIDVDHRFRYIYIEYLCMDLVVNTRILDSGSKAQGKGDSRIQGLFSAVFQGPFSSHSHDACLGWHGLVRSCLEAHGT